MTGLLMVRLHPAPFGLRLALAKACTTSGSHDLRESPGLAGRTPVGPHLHQTTPNEKARTRRAFRLGWLMGFEPTTTGITIQDSTAELQPP